MKDRLTYWKCPRCHGTGKRIFGLGSGVVECEDCDGTGNGLVDGRAAAYRRRIKEIETREAKLA